MKIPSNINETMKSLVNKCENKNILQSFSNTSKVIKFDDFCKVVNKINSDLKMNDIYYLKRLVNDKSSVIDFEDYLLFACQFNC